MTQLYDKKNCIGCYACVNICPKRCITMKADSHGFLYPFVDTNNCADCDLCKSVCPVVKPFNKIGVDKTDAYAAYSKDGQIRENSSSGGIFTLLAEEIIKQGGVVFGAAFSSDCKSVNHIAVDDIKDLNRLRSSKYLQSSIGDCYHEVKDKLDNGCTVFFTGTPCQIGGLLSYLKRDYDNLYTQDLICHGVPSQLVWQKYVEFREAKSSAKTLRAFFRHKKHGWKMYSTLFEFTNHTEYTQPLYKDLYMRGFLTNLYLRLSCYNCIFKKLPHDSDVTLADFWGIQNIAPQMDDNMGTSLVLLNSKKGRQLFDSIKGNIIYQEVDCQEAIRYNSSAVKSVPMNPKRDAFFADFQRHEFDELIKKYCTPSVASRIKSKIRNLLLKIKNIHKLRIM